MTNKKLTSLNVFYPYITREYMKIKTNKYKLFKRKNKTTKNKKGGKAIGSGGYGCVFRPALKCKDSHRENGKVSKLMKEKHAIHEYKEITHFLPILKKIPNYKNYYIVDDITMCKPDELNEEDLDDFTKKCKALRKMEITKENINDNLERLSIINIPDGGIDVGDYVEAEMSTSKLNYMLIDLLKNGIIPMNKKDVYHGDVKESNILVGTDNRAKLIDWGLSAKTDGEEIPNIFQRKPFQYNIPFSTILFNETFEYKHKEFIESSNGKPKSKSQIKSFVRNYIYNWNEERGDGHLKLILKLIKLVTKKAGMQVIIDYISEILINNNDNTNWINTYFKRVFLRNLDVWGLIMSYSPILEKTKNKKLIDIFEKHLFHPKNAIEPIDVDHVIHDLNEAL
jgi:serine/threonine protein kinase